MCVNAQYFNYYRWIKFHKENRRFKITLIVLQKTNHKNNSYYLNELIIFMCEAFLTGIFEIISISKAYNILLKEYIL